MKSEIENRLYAVTNYAGTQHLPGLIALAIDAKVIGSSPDWMVAKACMTPDEYAQFGQDGMAWNFLKGKRDLAQNGINVARKVVEFHCRKMKLICDWSRIGGPHFQKAA